MPSSLLVVFCLLISTSINADAAELVLLQNNQAKSESFFTGQYNNEYVFSRYWQVTPELRDQVEQVLLDYLVENEYKPALDALPLGYRQYIGVYIKEKPYIYVFYFSEFNKSLKEDYLQHNLLSVHQTGLKIWSMLIDSNALKVAKFYKPTGISGGWLRKGSCLLCK